MAGADVINRGVSDLVSPYITSTAASSTKGGIHKGGKVSNHHTNNHSNHRKINSETGSTRTHNSHKTGGKSLRHLQVGNNNNTNNNCNTNTSAGTSGVSVGRSNNSSTGAGRSVSRSRHHGGKTSGSMRTGRIKQRHSDPNVKNTPNRTGRHHSRDANSGADDVDNKKQQVPSGDDSGILPPISRLSKDFGGKSEHASPRTLSVPTNGHSGILPGFPFSRLATRGGGITPDIHGQKNVPSDSVFTSGNLGRGLTNNSMAVVSSSSPDPLKSLDALRRSPTIDSADKAKIKFEKKVLNTMTENDGVLHVPSSPRLTKNPSPTEGSQLKLPLGETGQTTNREVKSRQQRRTSTKSDTLKVLPKVVPAEEPPFSIRQKIEQFRKWHEEQYTDKLKHLKVEGDQNTTEPKNGETIRSKPFPETGPIDFAKILEDNIIQNRKTEIAFKRRHEKQLKGVSDVTGEGKERPLSSVTWKTWRDVNQSDAYTDVQKYIQDNDLMDEEREKWIKLWIEDVHSAMEEIEQDLFITDDD